MLRGGTTSYYEQDGLNSVGSLTNSSGALAQTYTYDSFGKVTASTGTLTNPFQYTAREFDPETGIYEYRARYLDQNTGRFLSEDPKQFAGGSTNFYDYVSNNPVNMRDPEGQSPVWGCGADRIGQGARLLHTILPRRANIRSRGAIPIRRACIMTSATTNAEEIILVARGTAPTA